MTRTALVAAESVIPEDLRDRYRRTVKQHGADAMAAVDYDRKSAEMTRRAEEARRELEGRQLQRIRDEVQAIVAQREALRESRPVNIGVPWLPARVSPTRPPPVPGLPPSVRCSAPAADASTSILATTTSWR